VKMISRAAGTAAVALAVIGAAAAAGPALAARAGAAAPPVHAIAARQAAAVTTAVYPGHPLIPATGRARAAVAGQAPASSDVSNNWSGYAVTRRHATFRYVQATFFVPYVNCTVSPGRPRTYSSHWVGLDGFNSKTVEQDGFEADCRGSTPGYRAWYELYPRPETPISGIGIKAGDSITATVSYSAPSRKYTLEVADNSTHRHFRISLRCQVKCNRSSAEVISEAPTGVQRGNDVLLPLADYQAVSYTNVAIADRSARGGLASPHWRATRILQVSASNSSTPVAVPTPIHGNGFDSYWLRQR